MMMFWMKTQEKWREVDRIELTGKDGKPLAVTQLNREQRVQKIEQYLSMYSQIQAAKLKLMQPTIDVENQLKQEDSDDGDPQAE
jgi:hypothetical protein